MSGVHRAELADDPATRAKLLLVQPRTDNVPVAQAAPAPAPAAQRQASGSASSSAAAEIKAQEEGPVAGEAVEMSVAGAAGTPSSTANPSVVIPIADDDAAAAAAPLNAPEPSAGGEEQKQADAGPRSRASKAGGAAAGGASVSPGKGGEAAPAAAAGAAAADDAGGEDKRLRTPEEILGLVDRPFTWSRWWDETANVSNAANLLAFLVFAVGLALELNDSTQGEVSKYVLSAGLFGFAGSITNWLAVKMLFDKVPFLYGSGVIPNRFVSIRLAMKEVILAIFFDEHYMEKYMAERVQGFLSGFDMKAKVQEMMTDPRLDEVIVRQLEGTAKQPGGAILVPVAAMLGGYAKLVPLVKPLLGAFASEMVNQVQHGNLLEDNLDVRGVRQEIESYMDEKIQVVTPQLVKKMMEDVMRKHLGMLVVWGGIFGGGLGVISTAAGYGG